MIKPSEKVKSFYKSLMESKGYIVIENDGKFIKDKFLVTLKLRKYSYLNITFYSILIKNLDIYNE
jgi:hypothetical protein